MKTQCVFRLLLNVTANVFAVQNMDQSLFKSCLEFVDSNSQTLYKVFL